MTVMTRAIHGEYVVKDQLNVKHFLNTCVAISGY